MKKLIVLLFLINAVCFANYNRIIIMAPSMFEVACLLNVENKVIGLGEIGGKPAYPEEKSITIKKMGNAFRPSRLTANLKGAELHGIACFPLHQPAAVLFYMKSVRLLYDRCKMCGKTK